MLLLAVFLPQAHAQTSSNLVTSSGWTGQTYSGNIGGANPVTVLGCCTGYGAYLDTSATNGGITFSYSSRTVAQAIAINQALSGTGVQLSGYNYSWQYLNQDYNAGTLTGNINLKSNTGSTLGSWNYTMPTTTNWTTMSGTQNFSSVYSLANVSTLNVSFTGNDNRFWGGFYGPRVRNIDVSLNYTVDPCVGNPRYSPSCAGYNDSDMWSTGNLTSVYGTTFAINQALGFGNTGVRVHSVDWGYDYNIGGRYCSGWNLFGICFGWTDSEVNGNLTVYRSNGTSLVTDSQTISGENISGSFRREVLLGNTSPDISTLGNASLSLSTTGIASVSPYIGFKFSPDICNTNPLTSSQCPGYAAAYLTQQCTANQLYDPTCPGYAAAYFTQQCTTNALYNPSCPGYAAAYLTYQCSINPLYSTTCSGYEAAYKMQQCNLDGLYAKDCPNYNEAYAKKNILGIGSTTTTSTTTTTTTTVSTTEPTPTVSSSGTVTTEVAVVSDSNVNAVITSKSTSTDAASTTAPVNVTRQEAPQQVQPIASVNNQEKKSEEKKDDSQKSTGGSSSPQNTGNASASSDSKNQPRTARQEINEKRQEAARAKAVEAGKNLANEMGKAASMEQQIAVQNVVIQAMAFTPGFDGYMKSIVPDAAGYKPYTAYPNQRTVDNPRASRGLFGATDRLHQEMVNQQYGESRD